MTSIRFAPLVLSAALATLPSAVVPAQSFGPALELKKLEPLVGRWQTSGTSVMVPGQPEGKWTSESNYRWVLGGHYLRADSWVDFDTEGMGRLEFVGFMGWDRENKRYVSWDVSNMGTIASSVVHWTGDDTFVQVATGVEDGEPTIERWVTKIGDGKMSFVVHRAVGTGDFHRHVRGAGERISEQAAEVQAADTSFMADAAKAKMKRFAKANGVYDVKGWMIPVPGAPKVEIFGSDVRRMIFDDTVLAGHLRGNAAPGMPAYEAVQFIAWDPIDNTYKALGLCNYGEAQLQDARWHGNSLVMTGAHLHMGQSMVARSLFQVDDHGGFQTMSSHDIQGTAAPAHCFEATYRKKDS